MAFDVTPTSDAAPYLVTASFDNAVNIDDVNYRLEVRIPKAVGSCPAPTGGTNQAGLANNLLSNGSFEIATDVDPGSCQTIGVSIVDISTSAVISSDSGQISNL